MTSVNLIKEMSIEELVRNGTPTFKLGIRNFFSTQKERIKCGVLDEIVLYCKTEYNWDKLFNISDDKMKKILHQVLDIMIQEKELKFLENSFYILCNCVPQVQPEYGHANYDNVPVNLNIPVEKKDNEDEKKDNEDEKKKGKEEKKKR